VKWPYGLSNFNDIRTEGYLYIDKTMYIEKLEHLASKYVFFIRPRRFGKSLFLSMLEHYYDLSRENDFERLFGDLYIGKNSTERRNQYFILRLNFSGLDTSDNMGLKHSFIQTFKNAVIEFFDTYSMHFENVLMLKNRVEQYDDLRSIWDVLFASVKKSEHKIYLIIDEYDHFANNLIAIEDGLLYNEIIHTSGFVRNFYEAVKIGTESVIDRIFITGVSPIMLDDLTSGFNISENLTMHPIFGEMLGFTEEEVRGIVTPLSLPPDIDLDTLMDGLRSNYNGYLFYEDGKSRVYNPTMILYFFKQWSMLGSFPKQLIDDNVKIDYNRLRRLVVNDKSRAKMEEIILNERASTQIVSRFSLDRLYDERYFVSLLFYMGLLTIKETQYGVTELVIPNYVIKTVFWEYFAQMLEEMTGIQMEVVGELRDTVHAMAFRGNLEPFIHFIHEKVLQNLSSRDMMQWSEKNIKLLLMMCLSLTNTYKVISEREVRKEDSKGKGKGKGYVDLLLERNELMPKIKVEWLLELKVIKKEDWQKKGQSYLEEVRQKAIQQLREYKVDGKPQLQKAVLIFIGTDEVIVEKLP
jgi:hypothetical protein